MKTWPALLPLFVGLLLFAVEGFFLFDTTWDLLAAITLLPALIYAVLTQAELSVIGRKREAKSGTLIGAYMLFKGVRLLLTVIALASYIYADAPLRMAFIVNVLVLFFSALAITSLCHLRAERKNTQ